MVIHPLAVTRQCTQCQPVCHVIRSCQFCVILVLHRSLGGTLSKTPYCAATQGFKIETSPAALKCKFADVLWQAHAGAHCSLW